MVEETAQNNKKKVNCAKAADMRYRTLENLGRSQKRQRKDEVENETAARGKRRRSGSDMVAYLQGKKDLVQKWKMEEMQLQKQRLEAESKKEEQSKKQHQDLMQVMLQQTNQQQEQCAKFSEDVHANAAAAVSNYNKTSRKTKLSHGLILCCAR